MSLPTPVQQQAAAQALVEPAKQQLSILGFNVDSSQIEAVANIMIEALCMKAWKAAAIAGQAAADAITTEAQAEASQRKP